MRSFASLRMTRVWLRRFYPATQHFRDAPRLGDAAAAIVRFARVENFADRSDSLFVQMVGENAREICARPFLSSG